MPDLSELQSVWDCAHQEKSASEQAERELVALVEHLCQRLPPGAPVLDAGCGRGRNTLYLSRMGFTVYGCDLSPMAIEVAQARLRQGNASARLQVANLARLPYSDGSFAASACVHVLPYHFKVDIAKGMRELWRVLQPDGWLYVDFLDCDDAEYGCGSKLEEHTFLDPDGVPIHFSSQQEINELLRGFTPKRLARLEVGCGLRPRVAWVIWAVKHKENHYAKKIN